MKKRRVAGRTPRDPTVPSGEGQSAPSEPPADGAPEPTRFLYAQCPGCGTVYRIGVAQLRAGRGEARCQECQAGFSVLDTLAESAVRAKTQPAPASRVFLGRLDAVCGRGQPPAEDGLPAFPAPDEPQAGETPAKRPSFWGRAAWAGGALLLLVLLGVQLVAFRGPQLVQNERLRPWLETACQTLGCRLPAFRAPGLIQIIDHNLHPAPDGLDGYEFTLVLANQAPLPQAFPAVRLTLAAYNGSPVAVRLFEPADYLPKTGAALMPVGELQEIRLLLAKPRREIGGFSFELL